MTEVRIRNVEPWIVAAIHKIAKQNGRSMENEIKEALHKLAGADKKKWILRLRRGRNKIQKKYGILSDSTPEIRAEREEW